MNCIVVDDDKMACTAMRQLIAEVDFLNLKQECSSPIDTFNYLSKEVIDLIFLDVEMPGMTGVELIRNLERPPIIILVTAKKDYAVEAFELNVADYIVKPVSLSRFMTAVSKAKELFEAKNHKIEHRENNKDYIFVRSKSILTKIKISDIIYIQALGDYVNIYADKRYTVHITLKSIEEKLPNDMFYRMHRSYLVALHHIENIENSTAYVGKHPLPIGEQFKKDLLVKLNLI